MTFTDLIVLLSLAPAVYIAFLVAEYLGRKS